MLDRRPMLEKLTSCFHVEYMCPHSCDSLFSSLFVIPDSKRHGSVINFPTSNSYSVTSRGGVAVLKIFQSFTTNRKIAFRVFLFKTFLPTRSPPPTPRPIFLKNIVRPWRLVIRYYFSMFTYKFSKHGGKRSLQTVKSFSSGFWGRSSHRDGNGILETHSKESSVILCVTF